MGFIIYENGEGLRHRGDIEQCAAFRKDVMGFLIREDGEVDLGTNTSGQHHRLRLTEWSGDPRLPLCQLHSRSAKDAATSSSRCAANSEL